VTDPDLAGLLALEAADLAALAVQEAVLPARPLPPRTALAYLLGLVPQLDVRPSFDAFGRRKTFTLAAAHEEDVLDAVQKLLANVLASGDLAGATKAIADVLDAAHARSTRPGYSAAVLRTNAMDAYQAGVHDELLAAADTFPVWKYSNPDDSRSRPSHAKRNGKYYPSTVPFDLVRGTAPEDAINCRCVPIPVDKWEWAKLKSAGARIAGGYDDVPMTAGMVRR
jgi:hypothetical protein